MGEQFNQKSKTFPKLSYALAAIAFILFALLSVLFFNLYKQKKRIDQVELLPTTGDVQYIHHGETDSVVSAMILEGTISEADLADSAVVTIKLADGSITTAKIDDGSITSAKIADGTVLTIDIADSAIVTAKVEDGAITGVKFADGSVSLAKFSASMCSTGQILKKINSTTWGCSSSSDASGGSAGVASIEAGDGLSNSGTGSEVILKVNTDGTTIKIVGDSLQLADGAVTAVKLANNSVATAKITDGAVTAGKLANGAITEIKLANGSVATAKLVNGAITTAKIGDTQVTGAKIADLAVSTMKLADNAITTVKIQDATILFTDLAQNACSNGQIMKWDNGTSAWTCSDDNDTPLSEAQIEAYIFDADNTGTLSSGTLALDLLSYTGDLGAGELVSTVMIEGENISLLNNDSGYITSYMETDPVYSGAPAAGIAAGDITNWNTAYGWGDWSGQGFITASSTNTLTNKSGNISMWTNDSGYLTSFTETDPVWLAAEPNYFNLSQNETISGIPAFDGGTSGSTSPFTVDSNYLVTNLNADFLDGHDSSYFQTAGSYDNYQYWTATDGAVNTNITSTGTLTFADSGIAGVSLLGNTLTVSATEADTLAAVTGRGAATADQLAFNYNAGSPFTVLNSTVVTNLNADLLDGQHASAFLTSFTETDPIFAASDVYDITNTDQSNWDTAYGWGDHSTQNYLDLDTNPNTDTDSTDDLVDSDFGSSGLMAADGAGAYSIVTNNSLNWNIAYGWGDWSGQGFITASSTDILTNKSGNISMWINDSGYLTSFTELDPVWLAAEPNYFNLSQNETVSGIPALDGGTSGSTSPFTVDSNYLVTDLNADLLDGHDSSYFQAAGSYDNYQYWTATDGAVNTNITSTGTLTFAQSGIAAVSLAGNTLTISATEADSLADVTGRGAVTTAQLAFNYNAGSPFTVLNSTVVTNLNADFLDGLDSTDFLLSSADNWVDEGGDTMTGNLILNGANILTTTAHTGNIGSTTAYLNALYVDELYTSGSSIYMNGSKILESGASTLNFTADTDQNLQTQTAGSGNLQFTTSGTGNLQLTTTSTGDIVLGSSDQIQLTSVGATTIQSAGTTTIQSTGTAGHIIVNASGANAQLQLLAGDEIDLTVPIVDINGNLSVSGNITDATWTANEIQDLYISDGLTVSALGTVADGALSSNVSLLGQTIGTSEVESGITLDTEWDNWNEHPSLTDAYILVGNSANQAAAISMTGDVSISNTGVTAVADDSHTHTSATLPASTSYLGAAISKDELENAGVLVFDWSTDELASDVIIENEAISLLTNDAGFISDDTSVAKNHLINSGILSFDWTDGEIDDALTINSTGAVDAGAIKSGNLNIARMPAGGDWSLSSNLNVDGNLLYLDHANGRVGIGTTSPGAKLDITDSTSAQIALTKTGTSAGSGVIYNDGALNVNSHSSLWLRSSAGSNIYANYGQTGALYLGQVGTGTMNAYISGNVGIGTTGPTEKLDVEGNLQMNSNQIFDATILDDNFRGGNILGSVYNKLIRADQKYSATCDKALKDGSIANMFDGSGDSVAGWDDIDLPVSCTIDFGYSKHYWRGLAIHFPHSRRTTGVKFEKYYDPDSTGGCDTWTTIYETTSNSLDSIVDRSGYGNHTCKYRITLSGTPTYTDDIRIGEISAWQFYNGSEGSFVRITGDTMYGGLNVMNGNVGIGTTSPGAALTIDSPGDTVVPLFVAGHSVSHSADLFQVAQNAAAAPAFVIDSDGNVGIGATNPGATLDVQGDAIISGGLRPDYDSGWFAENNSGNHITTLTHNLGVHPSRIQVWFSADNPPSNWIYPVGIEPMGYPQNYNVYKNPSAIGINTTQIQLAIYSNVYLFSRYQHPATGTWYNYNSGYYKVQVWK